jgi:UDP-N-acetylmuramyl pentapeptide phosphotransferase/UDP-N-acetylglucosamine-1-phosphate transferase
MILTIILSICAFLMSLLGTRITILALRERLVPLTPLEIQQGKRLPVPTGGGVAVVMSLVICLMVAEVGYSIMFALLLLAALALLGDLIRLPAWVRLLVQVLSVLVALGDMQTPLFGGAIAPWLDKGMTLLLWVWVINMFHFMDGIDGMTPTQMVTMSMGLCMLTVIDETFPTLLSTYSLVTFSVGAGFMWWNWHPAKVRLGEVGTMPIGFLMGYLLLTAIQAGYGWAAFILPAYYVSDASITLLYRLYKRRPVFVRHSEYYYRQAVSKGRRHDTVVRYIFGVNLLLMLLAVFSVINPELDVLYAGLAYMAVFMILGFFAHAPHNPHHEPF